MRTGTVLLWLSCLMTTLSFADSIRTFQVTQVSMSMGRNDGSGDNVVFSLTGPGLSITGLGGMACFDWCSGFPTLDPSGVTSQIFVANFLSATLGGTTYTPDTLSFQSPLFDDSGGVNAFASGYVGEGDSFIQFNLISPTGDWSLSFAPVDGEPGYYTFTRGQFRAQSPIITPEPGTIALTLTGLWGIAGLAKRKLAARL
jgi:hypothetical protein